MKLWILIAPLYECCEMWKLEKLSYIDTCKNSSYFIYITSWSLSHIVWERTLIFLNRTFVFFLIIKPTRCTNFSNLFLEWNSTYFGQFIFPPRGTFHYTHSNDICHTCLLKTCEQAVSKPVWHIPLLCVQWKTPDKGHRNCPKHVEFVPKINLRN